MLSLSMDPVLDSGDKALAEQALLQRCVDGLEIARASIWLYDEKRNAIRCQQICPAQQAATELPALTRQQFPRYFAELDKKRVIKAVDARADNATFEFTEPYLIPQDIWSMLDVPLRYQGEVIGIICCEEIARYKHWTDEDAGFVGVLSDLYGRILAAAERQRYQQQLEHANERLESLVRERTANLQKTLDQLRQTQQHLIESEKMASLGNLVAGIAHEVNTPVGIGLTGISHCSYLLSALADSVRAGILGKTQLEQTLAELQHSTALVERNLHRAAELIRQFKQSAVDQSHYELHQFAIDDYIQAVLQTLLPFCRQHEVQLELDLNSGLVLHSYPGAIAQVLTNLVTNACIHAFEPPQAVERARIRVATQALSDGRLLLQLTDNGCGIPRDHLPRIFEPFFTTRRGRGGTGLGLSIVYNIVQKNLGGELTVASKPGIGTRFSLKLGSSSPES
ncbi:ATP-binding protein [Alishewanella sp. HH-ZS]|uniref:ATP-binding protein n=1 Tax=Alishewanella sp. HH-ZS TaxID=1856684 RepID=UPI00210107CF|nr:ATP-binding protein [Alishewanella sp. HH-ZS]